MKFTVLSGSPKGDNSVTLQYVLYIAKKFPEHQFSIHKVSQRIKSISSQPEKFQEVLNDVNTSDGVIWAFPLYATLVPSQYKKFIELVFDSEEARNAFMGKYTAAISTSIHFYDHSCHKYIRAICEDLNMKYVGYYSADTWDILIRKNRPHVLNFARTLFRSVQDSKPTKKEYQPNFPSELEYSANKDVKTLDLKSLKMIIVADKVTSDSNLERMVQAVQSRFSESKLFTFEDIGLKHACIGCMKCSYENICTFENGNDGFNDFWRSEMMSADIIVIAGQMKDRYLSSEWKKFLDRAYFMNHTPTLNKKQIGYIISGPLTQNHNLVELFQGFCEFQKANYAGYISDEFKSSEELDAHLDNFCGHLLWNSENNYQSPETFLGVSTQKLFRDDVYGRLRFVCQADHRNFKKNGHYDSFPQRDKFSRKMNRKMMFISRFEKGRKMLYDEITKGLVKPFKKLVADPNR